MASRVDGSPRRNYGLAAAFAFLQYLPGVLLWLVSIGLFGPEARRRLERTIESLVSGVFGGDTTGFESALLWLVLLTVVGFVLPLLVSFLALRRVRYVLTTLAAMVTLWCVSYAVQTYIVMPLQFHRSRAIEERFRTSVTIDTLTYELADRMPVRPEPLYGDGFEKIHLDLDLDVVEPGETKVAIKFSGSSSGQDIRKTRTLHLKRGKQRVRFDFVPGDFGSTKRYWLVPGRNPKLHPSWLEGWKCYAEVEVQRPSPWQTPGQERLWGRTDSHEFVLQDVQVQDYFDSTLFTPLGLEAIRRHRLEMAWTDAEADSAESARARSSR